MAIEVEMNASIKSHRIINSLEGLLNKILELDLFILKVYLVVFHS